MSRVRVNAIEGMASDGATVISQHDPGVKWQYRGRSNRAPWRPSFYVTARSHEAMYILAGVAKLEYAAGLGPVGGNTVGVRVPPPALRDDSWLAAWRSPVLRSQCCGKSAMYRCQHS